MSSELSLGTPSYHGRHHGAELVGVIIAMTIVTIVAMGMRLYVRALVIRKVGLDDYLLIMAFLFNMAMNGLSIAMVHMGLGGHLERLDQAQLVDILKYSAVARPLWVLNILFLKLSIACTQARIMSASRWRYVVYAVAVAMTTFFGVVFVLFLCMCRPYSALWSLDPTAAGACWASGTREGIDQAMSAVDVSSNFILALLPIPVIWRLHLGTRIKVSIMGLLSLGLIASVASIVRVVYQQRQSHSDNLAEIIARIAPLYILWAMVEINLGIIAAAATACRVIFQSVFRLITRHSITHPTLSHPPTYHSRGNIVRMRTRLSEEESRESITKLVSHDGKAPVALVLSQDLPGLKEERPVDTQAV